MFSECPGVEPARGGGTTLSPSISPVLARGVPHFHRSSTRGSSLGKPGEVRFGSRLCLPPAGDLAGAGGCHCRDGASLWLQPTPLPPSLSSIRTDEVFVLLFVGLGPPACAYGGKTSLQLYVIICMATCVPGTGMHCPGSAALPDARPSVGACARLGDTGTGLPACAAGCCCVTRGVFPPPLCFLPP